MSVVKKRSESFFGLHFDFHAKPSEASPVIGSTLSEDEIREICTLLHPDFLQIDCKGHPGWASYPTECGNAMPKFAGDPLALWRRVTAEEGVALYMHYSGVVDQRYCAEHPEDAVLNPDGTRNTDSTRTNGGYADNLLIPQLSELAGKYGVDGVWIDGDCWGAALDFDPETLEGFEKETGILLNGEWPVAGTPHHEEYREYNRELYRRYVRHYVDTLHARHPGFQIASNWAYTDHMPEAVSSDVDFLSGDLAPENSFHSARYAGRAIASQNHTWDLMAWNFRLADNFTVVKHPTQIMQEAAAVISLGGGFQNYITQRSDGTPKMEEIRRMKPLADFLRERQPFCFHGKIRHQVAMLISTYDRHLESASLYYRTGIEKLMGATALICDAGHSLEIVFEHTLKGHYENYPVIVIPETFSGLEKETVSDLISYAKNGGNLLLIGQNTCRVFSDTGEVPFHVGSLCEKKKLFTLDHADFGLVLNSRPIYGDGTCLASCCADARDEAETLACVMPFGQGKLAAIGADIGLGYLLHTQYMELDLIRSVLRSLYTPMVSLVSCSGVLELVTLEKDGKLMLQLVNANGAHAAPNHVTEKELLPCRDIKLALNLSGKPDSVILQPEGREIPVFYENNTAYVCIDRVDIHSVLEIRRSHDALERI